MSQKVYVDTNIIMDYLLARTSSDFFEQTVLCKYTIFISDLILQELKFQNIDADALFSWLSYCHKITYITINKKEKELAKTFLSKTHHNDALHAACAIVQKVDFLLTRNIKDFKELPVHIKHPKEI